MQAVEQQEGRFLERDLKTGFWYRVPYKRAVDKTSQGLRERDRDDTSAFQNDDEISRGPVHVPESFSGKSKLPPNLTALAQVAIDSANRDEPKSISARTVPPAQAIPAKRSYTKRAKKSPDQVPPLARHASTAQPVGQPRAAKLSVPMPPASRPAFVPPEVYREHVSLPTKATAAHITSGQRAMQDAVDFFLPPAEAATSPAEEEDMTPLPPSLEVRESSMFRLLKHTHLLPTSVASAFAFEPTHPLKLPPRPARAELQHEYDSRRKQQEQEPASHPTQSSSLTTAASRPSLAATTHPPPEPESYIPPPVPMAPNYNEFLTEPFTTPVYGGLTQQQRHEQVTHYLKQQQEVSSFQQQQKQQLPQQQQHLQPEAIPPAMTRFTSQVSDWLNSFWPTDTLNTGRQASIQQVQQTAATLAPPAKDDTQPLDMKMPASMAVAVPSKLSHRASAPSRKRKAQSSLPRLPYGGSDDGGDDNNYDIDGHASSYPFPYRGTMPTELEQSVSATLLKLAGSPSRFFSGLTSFFGETGVSAAVTNQPPQDDEVMPWDDDRKAPAAIMASSTKKSQNNLLDDYDESPMEARLRSLEHTFS